MNRRMQGLLLAALHLAVVGSLGAKLLYDRATRPRVWVRTAPRDPVLPIRGRYVSLLLEVQTERPLGDTQRVTLRVENNQLIADPVSDRFSAGAVPVYVRNLRGGSVTTLDPPVAYFIPEHVPDPSARPAGEELWAEVTVPKNGPPRPIRLGVKKGDGAITPLELK